MATNLPGDLPPWEYLDPIMLQKAVSEIRLIFRSNFPNPSLCTDVDARDLQLVQDDPNFVKDFVKQAYFLTPDSSNYPQSTTIYKSVLKSLQFRKEYRVHDLTPRDIPTSVLDVGFCYSQGQDIKGNNIFYLIVRKNKRDAELKKASKLYAVYILYRHSLLCPDQRITFFIDSSGAGVSNVDLDFLRFLLSLFQLYFPLRLHWALVYKMPWVLSATWNLVKRWLPPKARDSLVFTSPDDINSYVPQSQLLVEYGGEVDWEYQYPLPPEEADTLLGQLIFIRDTTEDERGFLSSFESASIAVSRVTAGDLLDHIDTDSGRDLKQTRQLMQQTPQRKSSLSNDLVEMSPSGHLCFITNGVSLSSTCAAVISIRNTSQHLVAFKIKATNLQIYKVSPTMGVVDLDLTHRVSIALNLSKYDSLERLGLEVARDKFLVMTASYPLDKPTTGGHIMRFWKGIEEHKIIKTLFTASFTLNPIEDSAASDRSRELESLRVQILSSQTALHSLHKRLRFLIQMLWLLCIMVTFNVSFLIWRMM